MLVNSSAIAAVEYEAETEELTVEFHSRGTYVYHGVSMTDYIALVTAGSIGRYFNEFIQDVYDYDRIG